MIEVRGLTKRYGAVTAVDDVSFTVRPGVVTGFLGPNGAGKTTTMRMILGLDTPTAGTATVDGVPYRQLKNPLLQVGALLDATARHPKRSARDHLTWVARSNGIPLDNVDRVLELVGLSDPADKPAGGFSLGMSQRLGLAVALLGDPATILLDEPVNGLDPQGIRWVRELLRGFASQGRTVFVSSHLLSEMSLTADHLIVIGQGKLLADLPTAEFIRRNSRAQVVIRTSQSERLAHLLRTVGLLHERGCDAHGRERFLVAGLTTDQLGDLLYHNGIPLQELSLHEASLEEAFMDMTAGAVEYRATTPGR